VKLIPHFSSALQLCILILRKLAPVHINVKSGGKFISAATRQNTQSVFVTSAFQNVTAVAKIALRVINFQRSPQSIRSYVGKIRHEVMTLYPVFYRMSVVKDIKEEVFWIFQIMSYVPNLTSFRSIV
jgi:hypothetical protein